MKKMIKRALCIVSATMCVLGAAITASADTTSFDVTPPGDPYSYAVRKADSEQRFYVTGTYFSKSGVLTCYSGRAGQGTSSYGAAVSSGSRASSAGYTSYAYPGYLYEMYSTSSVANMNVTGRYTP